jgi:hypothetical protein
MGSLHTEIGIMVAILVGAWAVKVGTTYTTAGTTLVIEVLPGLFGCANCSRSGSWVQVSTFQLIQALCSGHSVWNWAVTVTQEGFQYLRCTLNVCCLVIHHARWRHT